MPSNRYNSWRTGIQIDNIYPVGSIYMSVNPTNPGQLFGGSWEAIAQGTFLISAGENYTVQNTYGSATHTHTQVATTSGGPSNNTSGSTAITIAQMPSHTHDLIASNGCGVAVTTDGADDVNRWGFADNLRASGWPLSNRATGGGQGHTHTLSSHTHSTAATTTGSASNIPPSLAVYMWQRTG